MELSLSDPKRQTCGLVEFITVGIGDWGTGELILFWLSYSVHMIFCDEVGHGVNGQSVIT